MATSDDTMREQIAAEIELVGERLEALRRRVADDATDLRTHFRARADQISDRAGALASTATDSEPIGNGIASAVGDLGDAVDAMEADLDAADHSSTDAFRSAIDRRLRVWRARAERLQLQEALAEMEIRDELGIVADRLHTARARALVELRRTGADAKETVIDLRSDLEELMDDARHVIERAVDALVDDD